MPDRSRSATEVVIGLDVGTTRVKAVAFPVGGGTGAGAVREQRMHSPLPGRQEQDPAEVLAHVGAVLAECVAACAPARVAAVGVSAAMHGLVGLDRHGRPVTPVVTWADDRAAAETAAPATSWAAELTAATGLPAHPMTPLAKLRWFARHEPATAGSVRWWGGVKELVLAWLTGEVVAEVSSAAGTGLVDPRTGGWSPLALDAAGVDPGTLPPVRATTDHLPLADAVARATGLPVRTPVVLGAGDGPAATLGTGVTGPGEAALSIGTSAAVRTVVDRPSPDPTGRRFCYPLATGSWVVGAALANGGAVARWAGTALAPDLCTAAARDGGPGAGDDALLDLAASVPAGSEGLVMLPFLAPERPGRWRPDLAGAYLGLRPHHTRAHLARAAVEGVCVQLGSLVEDVDAVTPLTSVRATGGVFLGPLWADLVAAAVGRPLRLAPEVEAAALGAAALALVGTGRAADPASALADLAPGCVEGGPVVSPRPDLVEAHHRTRAAVAPLLAALAATS